MGVSSYINRNNKVAIFTGSVTFYPKITKFAVEVSAYKGKLNFVPDVSEMPKDQSFSFLFWFSVDVFSHKSQNRL